MPTIRPGCGNVDRPSQSGKATLLERSCRSLRSPFSSRYTRAVTGAVLVQGYTGRMRPPPLPPSHTRRTRFRPIIVRLGLPLILFTAAPELGRGQPRQSAAELLETFGSTKIFWQQFEVAKKVVEVRDASPLAQLESWQLESWLSHRDRHVRGNVAFMYAALGDRRGFDVITAILNDRSERPEGQGIPGSRWSLQAQIAADRYYAVHLLGELKDPRAIPVLVALLQDEQVNYKVAWALGEIGGKAAVQALVEALHSGSPDVRVIAIEALAKRNVKDALPNLRPLLDDNARSHFGQLVSVADAARAAITKLE